MRRGTGRRAVVVVTVALGSVVSGAPSAGADGATTFSFDAFPGVLGGLGYRCTPAGTTENCLGTVTPGGVSKGSHPFTVEGGATRNGSFTSFDCVGTEVTTAKQGKAAVDAGLCNVHSTFVITGFCDLAHGSGTASVLFSATTSRQGFTLDYTFVVVGTLLSLRGNYRKNGGPVEGDVVMEARFAPSTPAGDFSCSDGRGVFFRMHAQATLIHPKTMP